MPTDEKLIEALRDALPILRLIVWRNIRPGKDFNIIKVVLTDRELSCLDICKTTIEERLLEDGHDLPAHMGTGA